jgi:hypothetical protein
MLTSRAVAALAPDVVLQVIGEDALVLKLDRESVFSLNATGARIVQLLDGERTAADVVDVVAAEYGVSPEEISREVLALLGQLAARDLVTVQAGDPPSR